MLHSIQPLLKRGFGNSCRTLSSSSSYSSTQTPPLYRLVYFNSRGAAELTRYLLAVVQAPYDDVRYPLHATAAGFGGDKQFQHDKKSGAFRCNMDKLPVLQVLTPDGQAAVVTLGQSHATNRFLAERHGLWGDDLVQRAQMDAVYESVRDVRSDFLRTKRRPNQRTTWVKETLPLHCQRLEASLPNATTNNDNNNKSAWIFGGPEPSLADVAIFSLLGTATSTTSGSLVTALDDLDPRPAFWETCPRLTASIQAMHAMPAIQTWHATRPDTFS